MTVAVSVLALVVSGVTAWLTLFKRGTVRMTQPTVMYFGPDRGRIQDDPSLKIYLRSLLYATSKRGRIVESLYVRVSRGETAQNFNIWVYGDNSLSRGSGLYVGEDGVTANHHFLLPADGTPFNLMPGAYTVQVFAVIVGDSKTRLRRAIKPAFTR